MADRRLWSEQKEADEPKGHAEAGQRGVQGRLIDAKVELFQRLVDQADGQGRAQQERDAYQGIPRDLRQAWHDRGDAQRPDQRYEGEHWQQAPIGSCFGPCELSQRRRDQNGIKHRPGNRSRERG